MQGFVNVLQGNLDKFQARNIRPEKVKKVSK